MKALRYIVAEFPLTTGVLFGTVWTYFILHLTRGCFI